MFRLYLYNARSIYRKRKILYNKSNLVKRNVSDVMETIFRIVLAALIGASVGIILMAIYNRLKNRRVLKAVPTESRIEILKKYKDYDNGAEKDRHDTQMIMNNSAPAILSEYDYDSYCNRNPDNRDDIVFAMLDFVCDHFRHTSCAPLPNRRDIVSIIKSCEESEYKTNCRGLSLILSQLLRMNGVRARHVTCKPYEEPFNDCHVVVDCFLPSGKRIMLDPTYRLYLTDNNGNFVSLSEFREGIISGRSFQPCEKVSYNGEGFNYGEYIEYMTKNLFRFNSNYILDDTDSVNTQIELVPSGYNTDGYERNVQYTTDSDYFWDIG